MRAKEDGVKLLGVDVGFSTRRATTAIALLNGNQLHLARAGTANAFLAVLIPEVELLSAPRLKRGRRFDWLYEQIATTGRLELILSKELDMPDELWLRLRAEKDHELRAALICLLTAALAAQGTATIVGESTGGWFWLPQWSLWQPWAKQGLESAAKKMALKGYSLNWSKPLSEADSA